MLINDAQPGAAMTALRETLERASALEVFASLLTKIRSRIVGQDEAVDLLAIALLSNGHVLLEGAPGLAKTRLARLFSASVEGAFKRIQFTPDLLPSDLIGSTLYLAAESRFEFQKGPIFANFLLADEINRAPAKVQSALLEAMEERQVTSGDVSHKLNWPFFVVATQNPVEHDGTWDLPQAQLDRFLLLITVDYPSMERELDILKLAMEEAAEVSPPSVLLAAEDLREAQAEVRNTYLSEAVCRYIVRLVAGTRDDPAPLPGVGEHLACPASPRGTIALAHAAKASAWLDGRDHVVPEDVQRLAAPVLGHRLMLTYRADSDGVRPAAIINALLDQVDVV